MTLNWLNNVLARMCNLITISNAYIWSKHEKWTPTANWYIHKQLVCILNLSVNNNMEMLIDNLSTTSNLYLQFAIQRLNTMLIKWFLHVKYPPTAKWLFIKHLECIHLESRRLWIMLLIQTKLQHLFYKPKCKTLPRLLAIYNFSEVC